MRPTKRRTTTAITATIALAALATTAGVAATGSAQEPPSQPTIIDLVAHDRESQFGFVDTPPRGRESAGDTFTINARLRDRSRGPAGRAQAVFVQTSANHAHGSATFVLPTGRIVVAGALQEPGKTNELTVLGGSRAYAGVRGSLTVTEARGQTRFRFTLTG